VTINYYGAETSITDSGGEVEWDLDTQASSGMAPNAVALNLYFGKAGTDTDLVAAYHAWTADKRGPLQGSSSFSGCEEAPGADQLSGTGGVVYTGNPKQDLWEAALRRAVIEGRSIDTTAVCQALLLNPGDSDMALGTAIALLELASSWRPLPDLTILVTDDAREAVSRAQRRSRCVFTSEQAAFMRAACALYERLAAADPVRYRVLDRRSVSEHEAAELIRAWIHGAGTGLGCLREPWQGPGARCMCCGRHADPASA